MNPIGFKPVAVAVLLSSLASLACAQYVWLNENGVKQYSDSPPPKTVPRDRVLKEPGMRAKPTMEAAQEGEKSAAPAADTSSSASPMSLAEKNAEFLKRRQEQAKKDAKAAEADKLAAEQARDCERAKSYKQSLESGVRIANNDKNGERVFMSDEKRAQELSEVRNTMERCK
ncbi:hypothetical protein BH11PSE11_BH11PSE11_26830 [soil metagenome]